MLDNPINHLNIGVFKTFRHVHICLFKYVYIIDRVKTAAYFTM